MYLQFVQNLFNGCLVTKVVAAGLNDTWFLNLDLKKKFGRGHPGIWTHNRLIPKSNLYHCACTKTFHQIPPQKVTNINKMMCKKQMLSIFQIEVWFKSTSVTFIAERMVAKVFSHADIATLIPLTQIFVCRLVIWWELSPKLKLCSFDKLEFLFLQSISNHNGLCRRRH